MQSSHSLGAIQTRRLHGRTTSSQVSTSSLPEFTTNNHELDQVGAGISSSKRAQSQSQTLGTASKYSGWGVASGPLRPGNVSSSSWTSLNPKWRWTWWRVAIAAYLLFSVALFSWSLLYGPSPGSAESLSLFRPAFELRAYEF